MSGPMAPIPVHSGIRLFDRFARRVVVKQLAALRQGQLTVRDTSSSQSWGEPSDLHVQIHVHRPRFFRRAMLGGSLSVAESYLQGDWDCDNLTSLFRIFIRNEKMSNDFDRGLAKIASFAHKFYNWTRANSRTGSRRNIEAHYDLGNDFFSLWLDESMAYSCGIFLQPDISMRDASIEKFDRVCRKLEFQSSDHVLEIGTGWGGFAAHAAGQYGCRVTTTTISRQQHEFAKKKIHEAGLAVRVDLQLLDYRDLTGQYDKLVSIEMIEAVGHQYLDTYFRQCSQLLKPDGSMLIQAIIMPESRYPQYRKSVDFIQRYVFPGGCLPSVSAILESVGRTSDLRLVHLEDFAPHYAETLRRWRIAFQNRLKELPQKNQTDEFLRLWNYYLCYCEAAFEERAISLLQIQFDKPGCRRDPMKISMHAAATHPIQMQNAIIKSGDYHSKVSQEKANEHSRLGH